MSQLDRRLRSRSGYDIEIGHHARSQEYSGLRPAAPAGPESGRLVPQPADLDVDGPNAGVEYTVGKSADYEERRKEESR